MKKLLNPVDIHIDSDLDALDADDLGKRLVDCVRSMNTDNNVINVVKIHIGDTLDFDRFNNIVKKMIAKPLRDMGANNCIFVPLKKGFIEDITIDHIEVIKDELNKESD